MTVQPDICILLAEDSTTMRRMEVKILKELGFSKIIEAADGASAIEEMEKSAAVDLIISDWNMPNKSGMDLLLWVRGHERFRQVPFIMATGEGDKKEVKKAEDAGVTAFVAKPFTPADMMRKIEAAFDQKPASEKTLEPSWQPRFLNDKLSLKIGHIQITDHLVLGVARHLITSGQAAADTFELETVCLPGWNPVQEMLENGALDGAFILAPIAMDLFAYSVPINMILLAHKNGSICVRKRGGWQGSAADFFRNKTFFIPHKMSIHHMLAHQYLAEAGLFPGVQGKEGVNVFFEVTAPVQMPDSLVNHPDAAGFMVAEPIGTKAIASGIAELQFLSSQRWPNHPCCIVVLRQELARDYPAAVQEFTKLLVQAGQLIAARPSTAAEIGVSFLDPQKTLGLKVPILKNVLTEPEGIRTDDLFPVIEDFERMQRYIVEVMGYGSRIDMQAFANLRFAEVACRDAMGKSKTSAERSVQAASARQTSGGSAHAKAMLDKEGKYLTFVVKDNEYGISILKIREIIGLIPITWMPKMPDYVKGVINLRGKVIPVVDLRLRLGLPEVTRGSRTCIIIMEVAIAAGSALTGVIVDSVSEVTNIKADQIEERFQCGRAGSLDYILGMAKTADAVRILLDMDVLLGTNTTE
jgi:chemotaxis signal transduction protein/ABC-type nitrate/sulfonate/bicarbonate transport system substrate-binding protein